MKNDTTENQDNLIESYSLEIGPLKILVRLDNWNMIENISQVIILKNYKIISLNFLKVKKVLCLFCGCFVIGKTIKRKKRRNWKNEIFIKDRYNQLVEKNLLSDALGDVGADKTQKKMDDEMKKLLLKKYVWKNSQWV